MRSILEDPGVRRVVFPLSVDFYHQAGTMGLLREDVELLEGTLVKKMPKSPLHEWIVGVLMSLLTRQLARGWLVRKEAPLTLERSEPEPDLAVVRGALNDFRQAHPREASLVVEVSISTLEVDRLKAGIYSEAGIAEYWLIIPEERTVEVMSGPGPSGYEVRQVLSLPDRIVSRALSGIEVEVATLFPD